VTTFSKIRPSTNKQYSFKLSKSYTFWTQGLLPHLCGPFIQWLVDTTCRTLKVTGSKPLVAPLNKPQTSKSENLPKDRAYVNIP